MRTQLSVFMSEDEKKRALVFRNKDKTFDVTYIIIDIDRGSSVSRSFDILQHAEESAEDWVI